MYSFLRGILSDKWENTVVIDCNGVGYEALVTTNCYNNIGEVGDMVTLYTSLHCREDEMSLFGFLDKVEREVFKKLILVNGVGPKMAISILSNISAPELTVAVATQQASMLKGIKGIGTKIRERILLELKEKMSLGDIKGVTVQSDFLSDKPVADNSIANMAIGVLVDWGVNKLVAQDIVTKNMQPGDSLEVLLQKSFKALGR
ncbi:MAG: Holliday junction branch migration protein RuvA [Clostridia bacterium]|nr:Holliday junction branch migration protein RuvA [Clostridia bacterium]